MGTMTLVQDFTSNICYHLRGIDRQREPVMDIVTAQDDPKQKQKLKLEKLKLDEAAQDDPKQHNSDLEVTDEVASDDRVMVCCVTLGDLISLVSQ